VKNSLRIIFLGMLALLAMFQTKTLAKEVVITPSQGESFVLDIDPELSFFDVVENMDQYLNVDEAEKDLSISYTLGFPHVYGKKGGSKKTVRNYMEPTSPSEKENIRYIVRSLARYNWMQLAKEESSLKKAGDKINHLHPYRFLGAIFTDEELKAGVYVIRNRSLVWGDYFDGVRRSLTEEMDNNNLLQFTPDFANLIGVDINAIYPLIQTRQWAAFVDYIINNVPRNGDPGRYDM
jgi:hypothetical protein